MSPRKADTKTKKPVGGRKKGTPSKSAKQLIAKPEAMIAERLKQCRAAMKKAGVTNYLVTRHRDYQYITGFTGEDSCLLITPNALLIISDGRFEEAIRREAPWADRRLRKVLLMEEVSTVTREMEIRELHVQYEGLSLLQADQLKKNHKGLKLAQAPTVIGDMRRVKDEVEQKTITRAIHLSEEAFVAMKSQLRLGMTENEIAALLEFEMRQRGASGTAFPTIVAIDDNAALPHYHPGSRKLKKGSTLLVDWGARYQGYVSDLTRVHFIGSIPARIGAVYEVVLEAQRVALDVIRPGVTAAEVDKVARDVIERAGYGPQFNHRLGHAIGMDVHEPPVMGWDNRQPLVPGMILTVEPGIYLPGVGGVRIEDDVLVTAKGKKLLSSLPKSLADSVIDL